MMCIIYESYKIECADIVCIICTYIYYVMEEGTRIARAECEDGAIYIYLEEGIGMAPEMGEDGVYIIYWEEGTRLHGRSAKTVL